MDKQKEQLIADLVKQIQLKMAEISMTQIELSRRMGVHRSRITHLLRGHRNWTFDSLVKIAIALDMDVKIQLVERKKEQ